MNLYSARKLLDLPEKYTPEILKKNYRKLAKEYHPDKNPTGSDQFVKINEAYEYLLNYKEESLPNNILNDLFKSFFRPTQSSNKKVTEILISPLEYFTGTIKEVNVNCNCNCELNICLNCGGGGYTLNGVNLDVCMECLGNGGIKNCNCRNFKTINVNIEPFVNLNNFIEFSEILFKIKINDPNYTFINNKLYYLFDITLKDSLIGFSKNIKNPFGTEHSVINKNNIVKQNDGFSIKFQNFDLILLFNIKFPQKITKKSINLLKEIDF